MNLANRATRILYVSELNLLLAVDTAGVLHLLDPNLRVVRSSPQLREQWPINALTVAAPYIFTRNRVGTIARWGLETLAPIDVYPATSLADPDYLMEGEEPSPTPARGIAAFEGRLYVNSGYGQLAVFDCDPFRLRTMQPGLADGFIEWICTDAPGLQVMSDKHGRLHMGNLTSGQFPITVSIDDSNLHRVRYDPEYDAFWVTQDAGDDAAAFVQNGLVRVTRSGEVVAKHPFTNDDVEFLELDSNRSLVLSGGFDGRLYIFTNTNEGAELTNLIGGFSHQLIDCAYVDPEQTYVLTQDGEITEVSLSAGRAKKVHAFDRRCVWDIQPTSDPSIFYCATDSGVAALHLHEGLLDTIDADILWHHRTTMGFIRRVVPLKNGDYIGLSRQQYVFRATSSGGLVWTRSLASLGHTISVDQQSQNVLVATDSGALALDLSTGAVMRQWSVDGVPVWASAYAETGDAILATRAGHVVEFSRETGLESRRMKTDPNPKRMWVADKSLWITGGFGIKEYDFSTFELRHRWVDLIENTAENAVALNGFVHVVSYGYQLASYEYEDEELTGLEEPLLDFTKGIAHFQKNEKSWILVGGRGGFVSIYGLSHGRPQKVREIYI